MRKFKFNWWIIPLLVLLPIISAKAQTADSLANVLYEAMGDTSLTLREITSISEQLMAVDSSHRAIKKFRRWEFNWGHRLGPNNTQGEYQRGLNQMLQEYIAAGNNGGANNYTANPSCGSNNQPWESLGPWTVRKHVSGIITALHVPPSTPGQTSHIFAGSPISGFWETQDGGQSWVCISDDAQRWPIPMKGVGQIISKPLNPNIMFATVIFDGSGYNDSGVLPWHRYVFGIAKSINGGQTWSRITGLDAMVFNTTIVSQVGKIMYAKNPNIPNAYRLIALINDNVFHSDDDGQSWVQSTNNGMAPGYTFRDVEQLPGNDNVLVAVSVKRGDGSNIHISTDGGASFFAYVPQGYTNTHNALIAVTAQRPNSFFVASNDATSPVIIRVSEYELSVVQQTVNSLNTRNSSVSAGGETGMLLIWFPVFEMSQANADVCFIGAGQLRKCNIGNTTLTGSVLHSYQVAENPNTLHADCRVIQCVEYADPSNSLSKDIIIVGTDGGVGKVEQAVSAPYSTQLNLNGINPYPYYNIPPSISPPAAQVKQSLNVTQFYNLGIHPARPDLIVGGCQDLSIFIKNDEYIDDGVGWVNLQHDTDYEGYTAELGGDGGYCSINWADPSEMLMVSLYPTGVVYRSVDYGSGAISQTNLTLGSYMNKFEQDPINALRYHCINGKKYDRRQNNGNAMDDQQNEMFGSVTLSSRPFEVKDIAVSKTNNQYVYLLGDYTNPPLGTGLQHPDPNLTGNSGPAILRSTDGGQTFEPTLYWAPIMHWYPPGSIDVDPLDPNRLVVGLRMLGVQNWTISSWNNATARVFEMLINPVNSTASSTILPSTSLPAWPIHKVAYEPMNPNVIWASNDVGLYRFDRATNEWECYNEGAPNSFIPDFKFNTCTREIFVATHGRGIWKVSIEETLDEPITIASSTTWNFPAMSPASGIMRDIVVMPGATLAIKGYLYMAKDRRIIVHPGAYLDIDGGQIGNLCGDQWGGIVVLGNAFQAQTAANQGRLTLRNNALVEHAKVAVYVGDPDNPGKGGGIVMADYSVFENNDQDVYFDVYGTKNNSFFHHCDFKLGDAYRGAAYGNRVTLNSVRGIAFTACNFINANDGLDDLGLQTAGIYSVDAEYRVERGCDFSYYPAGSQASCAYPYVTTTSPSSFAGLYYGIRATAVNKNRPFLAKDVLFSDFAYGIFSEGVNRFSALRNNFTLDGQQAWFNAGIFVNTGTGFRVEQNKFTGTKNPTGNMAPPIQFGTYVRETRTDHTELYLNDAKNLDFAHYAEGENKNDEQSGLEYLCNTNDASRYDFHVYGPNSAWGIEGVQGVYFDPTSQANFPAQNTFYYNAVPNDFDDFNNFDASAVEYVYNPSGCPNCEPLDFNALFTAVQVNQFNECESRLEDDDEVKLLVNEEQDIKTDYEQLKSSYLNSKYLYHMLLDGGNTEAMKDSVQFDWSASAWTMRAKLLSQSPKLSQKVLLEAAQSGVLPAAMLYEVCLANADEVKDKQFLYKLEYEIPNPLPHYMVEWLMLAPKPASQKQDLRRQMDAQRGQLQMLSDRLIINWLHEDEPRLDSVALWLQKLNSPLARYQLAALEASRGNHTLAQSILAQVPQQFELKDLHWFEHQQLVLVFGILEQMHQQGRTATDLNAAEQAQLQQVASQANDYARVLAHNLLRLSGQSPQNQEPLLPPALQAPISARQAAPAMQLVIEEMSMLECSPNPASAFVSVEFRLAEVLTSASIKIHNIEGRLVHEKQVAGPVGTLLVDTREFAPGLYIVSLEAAGSTIKSTKVKVE